MSRRFLKCVLERKQSSDGDVSTFSSEDKPTKFYIGVDQEMSEPNFMVQTILANLTGTIVNVTKENCQKQKEDEEDNRNKHVRPPAASCVIDEQTCGPDRQQTPKIIQIPAETGL